MKDIRHGSWALLATFLLLGCGGGGDGADRLDTHPVKGKITLSGSPVAGATVTFSPVDAKNSRAAVGKTNDNGEYTLRTYEPGDGAAAGDYVVLVTLSDGGGGGPMSEDEAHAAMSETGEPPSHSSKGGADGGSALPKKYSLKTESDLKATVKEGGGEDFNFDLKP